MMDHRRDTSAKESRAGQGEGLHEGEEEMMDARGGRDTVNDTNHNNYNNSSGYGFSIPFYSSLLTSVRGTKVKHQAATDIVVTADCENDAAGAADLGDNHDSPAGTSTHVTFVPATFATTSLHSRHDDISSGGDGGGGWLQSIKLSYVYTMADVRRRPRNTIIGTIAVFLLVFFTGMVLLGIYKAPYVLLRLAELSAGEADVIMYGENNAPTINFTEMNRRFSGRSTVVRGVTPRWVARATLSHPDSSLYTSGTASSSPPTGSNVLIIDSKREIDIGLGRSWSYRPFGYGETQVYYSALEYIGAIPNRGDRVQLSFTYKELAELPGIPAEAIPKVIIERPAAPVDPISLYWWLFFQQNNITEDSINVLEYVEASLGATVIDSIEAADGKYPSAFGNAALLDYHYLTQMIVDQGALFGPPLLKPSEGIYLPTLADIIGVSEDTIQRFNLSHYAMMMVAVLNDRYHAYYADEAERKRSLVHQSNALLIEAGVNFTGSVQLPLAETVGTFDLFKVLMVSSFVTVVITITVLGVILMVTLLRINADERQFELAMIRAQGMPQARVVLIFVAQSLTFLLPGTAFGMLCVFGANAVLEGLLTFFTHAPARTAEFPAVVGVVCTILGLLLPLLATWEPIKRALGGSLRDALDVFRHPESEAKVEAQRLEDVGLALWQVLLGFFLVIGGFIIYYMMPYAMVYQNMMLFFILVDFILVCMVTGLCLMLYVVEPFMEKVVLYILLWGPDRRLRVLIERNLHSHRQRNSKAYMMFLLSVAMLTAGGAMFAMLAAIVSSLAELAMGAEIAVTSSSIGVPLNQSSIDAFMRTQGAMYVAAWAYTSFSLRSYSQVVSGTSIGNFGGQSKEIGVVAVSDTFLDAVYLDYCMVKEYNAAYTYAKCANDGMSSSGGTKKALDVVRSMYVDAPGSAYDNTEYRDQGGSSSQLQPLTTGQRGSDDGNDSVSTMVDLNAKANYTVPILVSAALHDALGLSIRSVAQLFYEYRVKQGEKVATTFFLEPRALLERMPGFVGVSTMPLLFSQGSVFVPESYFARLIDPVPLDFSNNSFSSSSTTTITTPTLPDGAVREVLKRALYVRLKPHVTRKQREAFVNALQAYTNRIFHVAVDTKALVEDLQSVQKLIMYFFYFTAAVCITLCAFMLWVTFISNVQLHAWSYGVLRSLGFRMSQLIRGAIYEALCIVLSAFVLGAATGVLVGITLTLQFSRTMVIPFRFEVPYGLITIVFVFALVSAVVGSAVPCLSIKKRSISSVIKGI